jgi:hypothetical protein
MIQILLPRSGSPPLYCNRRAKSEKYFGTGLCIKTTTTLERKVVKILSLEKTM